MGPFAGRIRDGRRIAARLAAGAAALALVLSLLATFGARGALADSAPAYTFTYAPATIQAGVPVTFTAVADTAPPGASDTLSWDLGSGNLGEATGAVVTKTFTTAGTYTIRLQATDSGGNALGVDAQSVTVLPAEGVILSPAVIVRPVLRLSWARAAGNRVKLHLTCVFAACQVSVRLTTFEQRRAGKLVSLSSRGRHHGRRAQTGSATLHLYAGESRTFGVSLDQRGRRLLKRFSSLPVAVSLSGVRHTPRLTLRRTRA